MEEYFDTNELDLEFVSKLLQNLEAKFDSKPMPWMVAALKYKAEFLYSGIHRINFPVFEKKPDNEEREARGKQILEVVRKCKDTIGRKMLRDKNEIFVNKLREHRPNLL